MDENIVIVIEESEINVDDYIDPAELQFELSQLRADSESICFPASHRRCLCC